MKRLHVHVSVGDIAQSVRFYSTLFAAEPAVIKPDYAKWMLDDPHLNFAISTSSGKVGVDHMGLQVDNAGELNVLRDHMSAAKISTHSDGEATCCYAKSEKSWVEDPNGVAWEAYHTMDDAQIYGVSPSDSVPVSAAACCTPETLQGVCCASKPELTAAAACCGVKVAAE